MTEWWTYRLSDFLMFSPQVYWRLVARYNEAWWPLQCVAGAAAAALPWLASRPPDSARRATLVVLALAWGWVGWAFHWQQYAEIFLAAPWLAAASGVQALLLALAACLPARGERRPAWLALCAAAALYPLLARTTGQAWWEAEVFGFMPEPTALATIGAALAMPLAASTRALLLIVPTLSSMLGAATRMLLSGATG